MITSDEPGLSVEIPPRIFAAVERDTAWKACGVAALARYASRCEDMVYGVGPEDLDWIYIDKLPLDDLGAGEWRRWWDDQNAEATANGMAGLWDRLLSEPVLDPVVIGFYGRNPRHHERYEFAIWDGNHRIAASALTGRLDVAAVVGVLRGLALNDLPPTVRQAVGLRRAAILAAAAPRPTTAL